MNHAVPRLPPEGMRVREFDPPEPFDLSRVVAPAEPRALRVRVPRFVARRLFRGYSAERGDRATIEIRWPRR